MQSDTEMLCEIWEAEEHSPPAHSRLHYLEPIGVGSPWVESFTSYVMRLADTHSVHPRILVIKEILPLANPPYLCQDGRPILDHLTAFWKDSAVLNGTSTTSRRFVQALENLTERHDLHLLTMLPFAEVLSHRHLIRRRRAWCPLCYEQWREADQVMYEPLLWTLEAITRCPYHDQRLHMRCPNPDCAHAQFWLTPRGLPGYCMWCNQWLGGHSLIERKSSHLQKDEEWAWQQWVGSTLGELLAAVPHLSTSLSRSMIATVMARYLDEVANGSISVLARQLHVGWKTVQEWLQGLQIPQAGTFVQVCALLGTSPLRMLTENTDKAIPSRNDNITIQAPPDSEISKRRLRKMDTQRLRQALEEIIQNEEDPPPSMAEVGKRLKYDQSHLSKYFPDLCRAISRRYLAYQTRKGEERIQRLCQEVRQAVYTLHLQGRYPSQRQILMLLKTTQIFRKNEVKAAWLEAIRELELLE